MIKSGFFNSKNHDRLYYNEDISRLFNSLIIDGVFQNIGGKFIARPGDGMTVVIPSGLAYFNSTWIFNDTDYIQSIDTAPIVAGYTRIDGVFLRMGPEDDTGYRENIIYYMAGQAVSQNVQRPVPVPEYGEVYIPICYVTITTGVTAITASMISNRVGTSTTPFVSGILKTIDAGELIAQWESQFNDWLDYRSDDYTNWTTARQSEYDTWISNKQNEYDTWVTDAQNNYTTWISNKQNEYDTWTANSQNDYDAWISNKQNEYDTWVANSQNDYDAWISDHEASFDQWDTTYRSDFIQWSTEQRSNFDAWFAEVQYVLDGDVAGHLQVQIDNIEINVQTTLDNTVNQMRTEMSDLNNTVQTTLSETVDQMHSDMTDLTNTVQTSMADTLDRIETDIDNLYESVVNGALITPDEL